MIPLKYRFTSNYGNPYVDSLLIVSDGIWNDELDTLFSGSSGKLFIIMLGSVQQIIKVLIYNL